MNEWSQFLIGAGILAAFASMALVVGAIKRQLRGKGDSFTGGKGGSSKL